MSDMHVWYQPLSKTYAAGLARPHPRLSGVMVAVGKIHDVTHDINRIITEALAERAAAEEVADVLQPWQRVQLERMLDSVDLPGAQRCAADYAEAQELVSYTLLTIPGPEIDWGGSDLNDAEPES